MDFDTLGNIITAEFFAAWAPVSLYITFENSLSKIIEHIGKGNAPAAIALGIYVSPLIVAGFLGLASKYISKYHQNQQN